MTRIADKKEAITEAEASAGLPRDNTSVVDDSGTIYQLTPAGPNVKFDKYDGPTRSITFIQGYVPASGGSKIAKGTEKEVAIADARYLVESNIAILTDKFDPKAEL